MKTTKNYFIKKHQNFNTIKTTKNYFIKKNRVLLNRAPSSIQLHPPPPSSIQLHSPPPSSFQPPPSSTDLCPAQVSLHPALCNTLNNISTEILDVIGQFPQIQVDKFRSTKLSILTQNWHTWYFRGVDSESRLRFLKFLPQSPFLGKFGPKNSKLSVLSENWCTKFLKDADSKSRLRFLKF